MTTKLYVEIKTGPDENIELSLDDSQVTFFEWDGKKAKDIPSKVFAAAPFGSVQESSRGYKLDVKQPKVFKPSSI